MAFRGTYQHTLDAKHRLTVPARFRDSFETGVVVVMGIDPCVELWRPEEYEAHVDESTRNLASTSPQMRQMLRLMQGSAFDTDLDKVGRVGMTERLRTHGGLEKDVILIGVGRCLELWDKSRWEQHDANLAAEVSMFTAAQPHAVPPTPPGA
ncbi:MAG: division/cell wall cluster transcriptional repressor MraZ [Solirubrobacteraceae bacterium]|nr:division/cell wall cluster transcriptional repressor MraZ [Solirubrobacteraceae bacterium]